MSYIDETRLHLIYEILDKKWSASQVFMQYIEANRDYGYDDVLYIREAHFIMAVGPGDGKIVSELTEKLAVTHGAVSQIAKRLESKGYISRKRDPDDRRRTIVILTDKGKEFYLRHLEFDSAQFSELDKNYLFRFSDDELRMILNYEELMYKGFVQFAQKSK